MNALHHCIPLTRDTAALFTPSVADTLRAAQTACGTLSIESLTTALDSLIDQMDEAGLTPATRAANAVIRSIDKRAYSVEDHLAALVHRYRPAEPAIYGHEAEWTAEQANEADRWDADCCAADAAAEAEWRDDMARMCRAMLTALSVEQVPA